MNLQKNKQSWLAGFDYFFVLRPMLFFPGWSTMFAGYLIAYKSKIFYPLLYSDQFDYFHSFLLMISFAMIMGSTFVLNQIADKKSDKINRKLFLISDNHISGTAVKIEVILLFGLAFLIGFMLGNQVVLLMIVFSVLTGYLYNFSPAELKNRPWGSLFANAIMGWLAFALGWSSQQNITWYLIIDSLPYLLFNTALYLFTTLPDVDGDELANKKTLAVRYGIKSVILTAFFLFGLGLLTAIILSDYQALFFYTLSIPFFVQTIISFDTKHTIKTTKFGILFFALSICLKIPFYFIIMIIGFFITKAYFHYRFNINYPNFSGE